MADEQARMSNYLAEDIVDNIDEVRTARGEYDSLDDRLDDIESGSFTPTQAQLAAINSGITDDDVEQIDLNKNNISFVASRSGKNVLKFDSVGSGSFNGITYTVNNDGTVRANGTALAMSYVSLMINNSPVLVDEFANGQFVLSGCPSGGGSNTYSLYVAKGNYAIFDYGEGAILTPTSETQVRVILRVEKDQTVDIVFKPMIRLIGTDSTFEPYAPTNAELTAKVKPLEVQKISSVLTEQAAESYTDGTVCGYSDSFASLSGTWLIIRTYTVNADGNRKVQIVESNVGERKTRFFNGSWGSWT